MSSKLKSSFVADSPAFKWLVVSRVAFFIVAIFTLFYLVFHSSNTPPLLAPLSNHYQYFIIGICAAIIANSTGAGGGIVFLPAFIALGLSPQESLSTSLAIQCFGMTSGAFAWLIFKQGEQSTQPLQWQSFYKIVVVGGACSLLGLVLTQRLMLTPPIDVELLFSIFSIIVGLAIYTKTIKLKEHNTGRKSAITSTELAGVALVCFVGGIITAWLSIGVGEVLAVFLIFLGFRVNVSIAAAVTVTAVSVLSGVCFYSGVQSPINLAVLIYAAPGALLGGIIARHLATLLGGRRLKLAMSAWITLSAAAYLAILLTRH